MHVHPKRVSVLAHPPELTIATAIAAAGFVVPATSELRTDVASHLLAGEAYTVLVNDEEVGFAIFSRFPPGVLYLAGIILQPGVQGNHISALIVTQVRRSEDRFLALRTQSAIMWAAGRRICKEAWAPHPQDTHESELARIGNEVASRIGCQTYPVSPGFYGKALYGNQPLHRDRKVQGWWDGLCDFSHGDAVVCVGRLP